MAAGLAAGVWVKTVPPELALKMIRRMKRTRDVAACAATVAGCFMVRLLRP